MSIHGIATMCTEKGIPLTNIKMAVSERLKQIIEKMKNSPFKEPVKR